MIAAKKSLVDDSFLEKVRAMGFQASAPVPSSQRALDLAGRTRPDLVLMDLHLKGKMDAAETASQIRTLFRIPVIFLAGSSDDLLWEKARHSEPYGYLVKPFSEEQLKAAIHLAWQKAEAEANLRTNQANLTVTLDSIGDGVISTDHKGRVVMMNPAAQHLTGWSWEEARGMRLDLVFNILNAKTGEKEENPVGKVLHTQKAVSQANHTILLSRDNREFQIVDSAAPLKNGAGEISGAVLMFRDVSESYQAQQKLEQSEKRYGQLFRQSPFVLESYDRNGILRTTNQAYAELWGTAAEAALNVFNIRESARTQKIRPYLDQAYSGQEVTLPDLQWDIKDKSLPDRKRWLSTSMYPLWDDRGQVDGIMVLHRDITQRKSLETALEDSRAFLNSILDQSPHAIWISDEQGTLVRINRACLEMFGLTEERVVGKYNILKDQVVRQNGLLPLIKSVYEKGRSIDLDIAYDLETLRSLHLKGGEPRFFKVIIFPVFNTSGRLTNAVVQHLDITREKKAVRYKRKLEQQLRQAQKMEALGTLAGGIAHDFNNILAAMIGYAELTLEDAEAGRSDLGRIEQILKAAARGKDLVTQILTFSRKLEPELKPSDLNEVIHQTLRLLERTIPRMVRIDLDLDPDLRLISADTGQLTQVLLNLATNAKDAMPNGGRLLIRTRNADLDGESCRRYLLTEPGPYVRLTVSDTGQGMDEKTVDRIFDPFFTSKKIGEGTGLGLATVFGIVKSHGGGISCSSQVGRGTGFRIHIPALEQGEIEHSLPESIEPEPALGTETILVVDDEEALRTIAQQLLSRQGYQTLLASSGEEALTIYRNRGAEIDLVLLDMSMPGMGGLRCFQDILKINPKAKVIIFSGYARDGLIQESLDLGAAGFVTKPFSQGQLFKAIREALDRNNSPALD